MPVSDERDEDEETQPGDLVIEIRNGVPVVYTEPDTKTRKGKTDATGRQRRSTGPETSARNFVPRDLQRNAPAASAVRGLPRGPRRGMADAWKRRGR